MQIERFPSIIAKEKGAPLCGRGFHPVPQGALGFHRATLFSVLWGTGQSGWPWVGPLPTPERRMLVLLAESLLQEAETASRELDGGLLVVGHVHEGRAPGDVALLNVRAVVYRVEQSAAGVRTVAGVCRQGSS